MDFGGIYGWERSISWQDGAERGEGFGLSTGNTDHPSTPLPPNITYFCRGEISPTFAEGKFLPPSFNPPPTKHNLLLQREDFSLGKKKIIWAGTQFEDEVCKWWSSQFLLPFRQQKDIKELCPGLPENGSDFQKRSWWEASRAISIPPAKTKNNKRSLWFTTASPFAVINDTSRWWSVCICVECFLLTPHSTIYWSGADSHKSVFGWVSVGASNSSIHHKRSYITYHR